MSTIAVAIIKQYHQCVDLLLESAKMLNGCLRSGHCYAHRSLCWRLKVIEKLKPVSLESRIKADIDLVKCPEMSDFAADQHNRRSWIRKCRPVMLAAFRGSTAALYHLLRNCRYDDFRCQRNFRMAVCTRARNLFSELTARLQRGLS